MNCISPSIIPNPQYDEEIRREIALGKNRNVLSREHPDWFVLVPCGKCLLCKKAKASEWSLRCLHEFISSDKKGLFLTLTYDEDNLPTVYDCQNARKGGKSFVGTLVLKDLQKYIKRVRKSLQCRYFACGEYGSESFRPHYHLLIFGVGYDDIEFLKKCWKLGRVEIGDVSVASIQYVCGYISKKLYGTVAPKVYRFRKYPFQVMSKGLGKRYFDSHKSQILDRLGIYLNGSRRCVPRYYLTRDDDYKEVYKDALAQVESSEDMMLDYLENQDYYKCVSRQKILDSNSLHSLKSGVKKEL